MVYGKANRHDGVMLTHDGQNKVCLIDFLLAHTQREIPAKSRLVLIRLVHPVDQDTRNKSVVHTYGHTRDGYELSTRCFIHTVLVDSAAPLHPLMIFIDPYWRKQIYGLESLFQDVYESSSNQSIERFFLVKVFSP